MNTKALVQVTQGGNRAVLLPYRGDEATARAALEALGQSWRSFSNRWSRLGLFVDWLDAQGQSWHEPDLAAYRDKMLARYTPGSTSAHLSTIRARYREIARDNGTRDYLYTKAGEQLTELGQDDTPANRKAFVDEALARLENAIDPKATAVKTETKQDRADFEAVRLTRAQASALIASPGINTLAGLRDTALLALMLCTGVREAEACKVDVGDLRQRLEGELALHVRLGKGKKTRCVPYGEGVFCLAYVDKWLAAAGIEAGPVFRGLYKGEQRLRPGRLSVRAVNYIVGAYPVMVNGSLAHARPHDLRRTYARRCYDEGMAPIAIQQNLGHADLQTTLGYIGELSVDERRPPTLYDVDLAALACVAVQGAIEDPGTEDA